MYQAPQSSRKTVHNNRCVLAFVDTLLSIESQPDPVPQCLLRTDGDGARSGARGASACAALLDATSSAGAWKEKDKNPMNSTLQGIDLLQGLHNVVPWGMMQKPVKSPNMALSLKNEESSARVHFLVA
jgi:hypothetical protein